MHGLLSFDGRWGLKCFTGGTRPRFTESPIHLFLCPALPCPPLLAFFDFYFTQVWCALSLGRLIRFSSRVSRLEVLLLVLLFLRSAVGEKDLKDLDKEVSRCCKAKQTFDRLVLTKEEALDMFDYNAFKK